MTSPFEYLDVDDLIELATLVMGESLPIRDIGLLCSAAARPRASPLGEDAYPDIWTKAAALLQSVLKNHALIDGNKRLGWLATAVFLELNGQSPSSVPNDTVYTLVLGIAAGQFELEEIADQLEAAIG